MDRSEWAFASSKQFANARSYRRVDSEGNPIAGANYRKSLALN
jgi:hypothetical protein